MADIPTKARQPTLVPFSLAVPRNISVEEALTAGLVVSCATF